MCGASAINPWTKLCTLFFHLIFNFDEGRASDSEEYGSVNTRQLIGWIQMRERMDRVAFNVVPLGTGKPRDINVLQKKAARQTSCALINSAVNMYKQRDWWIMGLTG